MPEDYIAEFASARKQTSPMQSFVGTVYASGRLIVVDRVCEELQLSEIR